jgi:exodeoxyribonuclease V gamma subunit
MAGLHLHRSNRIEILVEILAAQLRTAAVGDPFAPVEIIVGSRGMERWLRQALAERIGICANVAFPFPAVALEKARTGSGPTLDPWTPAVLTWGLLDTLPDAARGPGCEALQAYLEGGAAGGVDGFAWGFARRLAELFDRYVTWRPELAIAWSEADAIGWQPTVWSAVQRAIGAPHRALRLRDAPAPEPGPPLRIFALSTLAPAWLDGLAHIAAARDVEFYLLCPADGHFADDRGGHPLLASWGRVARDLQTLIGALPEGVVQSGTDLFLDATIAPDGAPRRTALRTLQEDIRRATRPGDRDDFATRVFDPSDTTIQLHDCHAAVRQVEVLRDALLALLDADPTLAPRDIVVMTPDLDTFAPRFAAAFDVGEAAPGGSGEWPGAGAPRLPYEIADRTVRRLNPVADALLRVLALVDGRATASEVLDLLAIAPVAARFDILPDDLPRIRTWATEAGICWGADAGHRARLDQPEEGQNTWRFGLDRLLLGIVCRDDGRAPAGIRPREAAEGADTRLVGGLCEFASSVFAAIEALRAPRSPAAWAVDLAAAVEALTRTEGQAAWLSRLVREELRALAAEAAAAGSRATVAIGGIRAALAGRFEVAGAAHGAGGAITLCGMLPERAVPYRVVCLLGMDDGAFPRSGTHLAFDLIAARPRIGDRNPRDEDRYVLLEAILSARDHLIVCFSGRDARTNAKRPPAVPVSELCDALDATWPREPGAAPPSSLLAKQHTLQAFDPRNFGLEGAPRTFDRRLLGGARAAGGARDPAPPCLAPGLAVPAVDPDPEVMELDDLCRFWTHPLRVFAQRRLGLWLPWDDAGAAVDREPIELGWIDHARMLREIQVRRAAGVDLALARAALRAAGQLPLGAAGDVAFDTVVGLVDALEADAERAGWRRGAPAVEIGTWLPEGRLVGSVEGATPGGLVHFAYGAERPVELLHTWLRLLAWRATEPRAVPRARIFFGKVKTNGDIERKVIGLDGASAGEALPLLARLRREGHHRALPYLPKSSLAVAKCAWDESALAGAARDPDRIAAGDWDGATAAILAQARDKALTAWRDEESGDAYYRHLFGLRPPFLGPEGQLDPAFAALAGRVWAPLLAARRTGTAVAAWSRG